MIRSRSTEEAAPDTEGDGTVVAPEISDAVVQAEVPFLASEIVRVPIDSIAPHPANPNVGDVGSIGESIDQVGFYSTVYVQQSSGMILAGEHRWRALRDRGSVDVPVVFLDVDDETALRILIADNEIPRQHSYADDTRLAALLTDLATQTPRGLLGTGFDGDGLDRLLADLNTPLATGGKATPEEASRTLAERFLVPPFSVLDARQGYWQDRKRAWLALGMRSELGRPRNLLNMSETVLEAQRPKAHRQYSNVGSVPGDFATNDPQFYVKKRNAEQEHGREMTTGEFIADYYEGPDAYIEGTSIFDPVLCEIAYRWYCPPGGRVLDPFAGGSVRGLVASRLGHPYVGVDLRDDQIAANQEQAVAIGQDPLPEWRQGDATMLDACVPADEQFDLVFTCPPYFNLERYSTDPADLSNSGSYAEFDAAMRGVWSDAVARLTDDRFVVVVIGNVREDHMVHDLAGDMTRAMEQAGCGFYQDAILVTAVGSLALRAARNFRSRKLGRTHQQVLVYLKGDLDRAVEALGPIDVPDLVEMFGEPVEEPPE